MEIKIEEEKEKVGKAIEWVNTHCSWLTVVLLSLILVTMCTTGCASYHGLRKKGENFVKNQDIKACMKTGMSKEECEQQY